MCDTIFSRFGPWIFVYRANGTKRWNVEKFNLHTDIENFYSVRILRTAEHPFTNENVFTLAIKYNLWLLFVTENSLFISSFSFVCIQRGYGTEPIYVVVVVSGGGSGAVHFFLVRPLFEYLFIYSWMNMNMNMNDIHSTKRNAWLALFFLLILPEQWIVHISTTYLMEISFSKCIQWG